MKTQAIPPTGKDQAFEVSETFFSTTDAKGIITAGNRIFTRTSGYCTEELVGQPHNIIRHPDMPRLVFRMLWDACRGGRPFMGYVKNQAKNGNHYWVFAVIVPIPGGFLSIRFKPTSPLHPRVEAMYAKMLAAEEAAIAAGSSEGRAADAAVAVAESEMGKTGFDSYEAFSHQALNTEIKARDAEVARRGLTLFPEGIDGDGPESTGLREFYRESLATYRSIDELFRLLDSFILLCDGIRVRKDAVQTIAKDFRLNALNANIAAHALGEHGVALAIVAQNLSGHGDGLSRDVGTLAANIVRTIAAVTDSASNLSVARLQVEMLLGFTAELSAGGCGQSERTQALAIIGDLRAAFATTLQHAFAAIGRLQLQLPAVMASKEDLRKDIIYLHVTQMTGLTEVARLPQAEGLVATFADLRAQIEEGKRELDQLEGIVEKLVALTGESPAKMAGIRLAMESMREVATEPISSGGGEVSGMALNESPSDADDEEGVYRSGERPREVGEAATRGTRTSRWLRP